MVRKYLLPLRVASHCEGQVSQSPVAMLPNNVGVDKGKESYRRYTHTHSERERDVYMYIYVCVCVRILYIDE